MQTAPGFATVFRDDIGGGAVHVGLDARMIDHSGIGVYLTQLVKAMLMADHDLQLTLFGDRSRLAALISDRCRAIPFLAPIYGLAERRGWPREAEECDVLHAPHYCAPGRAPRPLVVTVHDLIHLLGPGALKGPKRWWARHLMGSAVRGAAAVICDSEATGRDLSQAFPEAPPPQVIPLAPSPWFTAIADRALETAWVREIGLPRRFWLTVGIDKTHKRHLHAIGCVQRLLTECGVDVPLVMLGPSARDFRWGGLERCADLRERVIFPGWLPAERLPAVYRAALGLLMPSVREGFGLPAVEAMAVGCPVLAARAGSLPEVVGEGGLLLPPDDLDAWTNAMERLACDEDWRQGLCEQGRDRVGRFTWENTAMRTREVYEKATLTAP